MATSAIVVGSGPAGVACAQALLKRGCSVTMLDAGIQVEESVRLQIENLAAKPPQEWKTPELAFLKSSINPTSGGLPLKTAYGSDFPYRGTESDVPISAHEVDFKPSFAMGGFSTVWGAAMLPFCPADIADWPVSIADLAPHYRAALEWMPLTGRKEEFDPHWPAYTSHLQGLRPSRQAESLLNHLRAHEPELRENGVQFGQARLAVHAEALPKAPVCVHCGLCLYGCPYGCIYDASETLRSLSGHSNFKYVRNIIVKRVVETEDDVAVKGVDRVSRQECGFRGERVFLGAGILPTTKILLDSLEAYDQVIPMNTSQHFMVPLWLKHSIPGVEGENLHTLAQVFLEVQDSALSAKTMHLQLYTYNDLYLRALKRLGVGYLLSLLPGLRHHVLGRLVVVQGYLHSGDSATIRLQLSRGSAGQESRLFLDVRRPAETTALVRRLVAKLSRLRESLGAAPLSPFLRVSAPGAGYHNGGTFPMRARPSAFQSDLWGRPHGFKRVHAVDATVFPSTPATTITLSVMANAHRIGSFHE